MSSIFLCFANKFNPPVNLLTTRSFQATIFFKSIFGLLKGLFVENKKVITDVEIEKLRIESNERIEMAKLEKDDIVDNKVTDQSLKSIEFILEEGDKKVNFKIERGDDVEQAEIIRLIGELTK